MSRISFVIRLLYFLVAPFLLVVASTVVPMTGVMLNIVLLVGGFMCIELLRGAAERHRLVAALVKKQLRFEAYYRIKPPRIFVYYVLYLLMFPFWLFNRSARQEFGLYRGFTAVGVLLLLGLGTLDYLLNWSPEIAVRPFIISSISTLIVQIVLLIAFMMPLAVTIVSFQLAGRKRDVWIMLVAAAVSVSAAYLGKSAMSGTPISVEVRMRTRLRTAAAPDRAHAAQDAALRDVWAEIRGKTADIDADGWVQGPSLARARATLAGFYREDEAAAFTVHTWPATQPTHVLLQCYQRNRSPTWRAMTSDGHVVTDEAKIPSELYNVRPTRSRYATRRR